MWRSLPLFLLGFCGKLRPVAATIVQRNDMFLIVKKDRHNHAWQFPQGGQEKGESLFEAAQRELLEECGSTLHVDFLNARKIGHYAYRFPKNFTRNSFVGASVTFFHASFLSGDIQLQEEELCDYTWVRKEELQQYFHPDLLAVIQKFLP